MIPTKFSAKFITETFFPDVSREDINCGYCYDWAWYAYHTFRKSKVELWSNHAHAFVKVNGKFYDSECYKGTLDWRNLPCNKECKPVHSCAQTLATFKEFWSPHSVYHWQQVNRKFKAIKKKWNLK